MGQVDDMDIPGIDDERPAHPGKQVALLPELAVDHLADLAQLEGQRQLLSVHQSDEAVVVVRLDIDDRVDGKVDHIARPLYDQLP